MTIVKAKSPGETIRTKIGELTIQDSKVVPHGDRRPFVRYLMQGMLEAVVADMRTRLDRKLDNVVLIEGGEGSGKSNLAWWICRMIDPRFDISRNLIYSLDQLEARLETLDDRRQVFWLDELFDIASTRSWNSVETRRFVSLLVKCRSRQWTVVMCIPRSKDSDEYLKNHRAVYWFMCAAFEFEHAGYLERGFFELQKKTDTGRLQHVGYGRYRAIPEADLVEYEAYKERYQDRDLSSRGGKESAGAKYKRKYEAMARRSAVAVLMLRDAGVPRDEICSALGISQDSYYKMCKKAREETGDYGDQGED